MYEVEVISRGEEKVRSKAVVVAVKRKGVRRSPLFTPDDAPEARTRPVIFILGGVGEISSPF
jgi:hypothetical protein